MTTYDGKELRKRLAEATDFGQFHDYFLTNFVEKGPFMSMGRSLSRPRSNFILEAFGAAYGQIKTGWMNIKCMFVEVPELGLIHGTLEVEGKRGSVLYFEDIGLGLFVILENRATGYTNYMRFSTQRPTSRKPN